MKFGEKETDGTKTTMGLIKATTDEAYHMVAGAVAGAQLGLPSGVSGSAPAALPCASSGGGNVDSEGLTGWGRLQQANVDIQKTVRMAIKMVSGARASDQISPRLAGVTKDS